MSALGKCLPAWWHLKVVWFADLFVDSAVVFANMMDDWSCMVEIEKERLRCLEIDKDSESEVEWPEDEI